MVIFDYSKGLNHTIKKYSKFFEKYFFIKA